MFLQPDTRKWEAHLILRDHPFPVHSIAWSSDDSMLLTGAEHFIKLWDAKVRPLFRFNTNVHIFFPGIQTGSCIRTMDEHTETVTALSWLPDGSGFISGALDRKIIQWVGLLLPKFAVHCLHCAGCGGQEKALMGSDRYTGYRPRRYTRSLTRGDYRNACSNSIGVFITERSP